MSRTIIIILKLRNFTLIKKNAFGVGNEDEIKPSTKFQTIKLNNNYIWLVNK
jgi:hypothetical protein